MPILLLYGLGGHISVRIQQRGRRRTLQDADKEDKRSKQTHSAVSGSGDLKYII